MIWSFRKTAGLSTPGTPYGGCEAPGLELRGHFVGKIYFIHHHFYVLFLYHGLCNCPNEFLGACSVQFSHKNSTPGCNF